MKSDAFVFACRENPEVLRSLESIVDEVCDKILTRLARELNHDEFCRLQGEWRNNSVLKLHLEKLVRLRDAADKSANGRN